MELGARSIRFGILGCATISWKLARAMLRAQGAVPYAVGSRSLEKAREFAARIKELDSNCSLVTYGSYDEVLADPNVDAVYIPLPTGLHLEWVVKSAEHGKHILLEKPVSLTIEELDSMLAVCRKAGVQIMDGTMWVHNPRAAAMRDVIQDPERFGTLKRVNVNFHFSGNSEFMKSDIRVQKGLDELGCLGDVGWYCIKASLWAKNFELPSTVVAMPGTVRNDQGVYLSCGATLVWADGVVATFDCGFETPLRQYLQFAGTKATILLTDFTLPHEENVGSFLVEAGGTEVDGGTRLAYQKEEVRLILEKPQEALMVEAFVRTVKKVQVDGPSAVDRYWEDVMWKTQKVLGAVDESASNNCAVVQLH